MANLEVLVETGQLMVLQKKEEIIDLVFNHRGTQEVLKRIREESLDFIVDLTTAKGIALIKHQATLVANSKQFLDKAGMALKSEWQKKVDVIDAERKIIRDNLDALKIEVRAPLTAFENEQKAIEQAKKEADAKIIRDEQEEKEKKFKADQEAVRVMRANLDAETAKLKIDAAKIEADKIALEKAKQKMIDDEVEKIDRDKKAIDQANKKIADDKAKEVEAQKRFELEKEKAIKLALAQEADKKAIEDIQAKAEAKIKEIEANIIKNNEAHQLKIIHEAINSMIDQGWDKADAENFMRWVYQGLIKHVFIKF